MFYQALELVHSSVHSILLLSVVTSSFAPAAKEPTQPISCKGHDHPFTCNASLVYRHTGALVAVGEDAAAAESQPWYRGLEATTTDEFVRCWQGGRVILSMELGTG